MSSDQTPNPDRSTFRILLWLAVAAAIGVTWWILSPKKNPVSPAHPANEKFSGSTATTDSGTGSASTLLPAKSGAVFAAPTTAAGVTIQEGNSIDFSTGKPVLKDSPEEKALIAQSVKEMEAAAKEVSFGPPVNQPTPTPGKP